MTRYYQLVYYVAQKCVNYRDTDVYKNCIKSNQVFSALIPCNILHKSS